MAYGLKGIELVLLNAHGGGDSVDAVWENKIANLRELQVGVAGLYSATAGDGAAEALEESVAAILRVERQCFSGFDDPTGLMGSIAAFNEINGDARKRQTKRPYFNAYQQKVGRVIAALNNMNATRTAGREGRALEGGIHTDVCQLSGRLLQEPYHHADIPEVYYSREVFDQWLTDCEGHIKDALSLDGADRLTMDPITSSLMRRDMWQADAVHGGQVERFKKALLLQKLADEAVEGGELVLLKLLMTEEAPEGIDQKWIALGQAEGVSETLGIIHTEVMHVSVGQRAVNNEAEVNGRINTALRAMFDDYGRLGEGYGCLGRAMIGRGAAAAAGADAAAAAEVVQVSQADIQALQGMRVRLGKVMATGCPDAALDLRAHAAYKVSEAMAGVMHYKTSRANQGVLVERQLILEELDNQIGGVGHLVRDVTVEGQQSRVGSLLRPDSRVMSQQWQTTGNDGFDEVRQSPLHRLLLQFYQVLCATNAQLVAPGQRSPVERATLIGRLFTSYQRSKRVKVATERASGTGSGLTAASEPNDLVDFFRRWSEDAEIKRAVKTSYWCGRTLRKLLTGMRDLFEGQYNVAVPLTTGQKLWKKVGGSLKAKPKPKAGQSMTGQEASVFLSQLPGYWVNFREA